MNQLNLDDPYLRYYAQQAGSGVNNVYRGAEYQRGHGIGSFLGGLFRTVTPLLKSGARALGREAFKSGIGLVGDIVHNVPPKVAAKNRIRELTGNLKRKADLKIDDLMGGSGYKRKRNQVTVQSLKKLLNVKKRQGRKKKPAKRSRKPKSQVKRKKAAPKRQKRKTASSKDIFD